MKTNFIQTKDTNTANILKQIGFQLVNESNNVYTFLNSNQIAFSKKIDSSKISYTNQLNI